MLTNTLLSNQFRAPNYPHFLIFHTPPLPSPSLPSPHSSCRAAKHLFSWSGLVESLDELTHTARTMGGLVESLLRSAVMEDQGDEVIPAYGEVLLGVVSHFSLRDDFAEELIRFEANHEGGVGL